MKTALNCEKPDRWAMEINFTPKFAWRLREDLEA
jgi:hypothetical protein